jgi:hypothetical protein
VRLDSWKWDGASWSKFGTDAPMKTSNGAYDHSNKRLLLLGDVFDKTAIKDGDGIQKIELWEVKDGKWRILSGDGPQPDGQYEVAYNKQNRSLVIPTWESGKSFVWEWANEKWTKKSVEGKSPEARNRFALAYDDATKAVYMFGGRSDSNPFFSDFWKWDGTRWEDITAANMPAARAAATMEAGFGGLVLYGGILKEGPCNEIWIWANGQWVKHGN